jgi:hypothetical protein
MTPRLRALLAAPLAAALAAGCSSAPVVVRPWSRNALCAAPAEGAADAKVSPDAWLALLLQGYDARARRATRPAVDCTGAQVDWTAPAIACADSEFTRKLLPDGPIAPDDVLVSPAGPRLWLVWILTGRYASGDALGPVALVEREPERLVVRALGTLRAHPVRARLRLERAGGEEVLVAEGEACAGSENAPCARSARLMPLQGERFAQEPLVGEGGRCVAPAVVDLARQENRREDGALHRLELSASLAFDAAGIRVDELVVVQDVPRKAEAPPRLLHRAQDTRVLTFANGRLSAPGPSLWARMTEPQGR